MGLKDVINKNLDRLTTDLDRLTTDIVPGLREAAEEQLARLRTRLDHFNRSLADKALPEERKMRVGRISLETKAKEAGQGKTPASKAKAVPETPRKPSPRHKAD